MGKAESAMQMRRPWKRDSTKPLDKVCAHERTVSTIQCASYQLRVLTDVPSRQEEAVSQKLPVRILRPSAPERTDQPISRRFTNQKSRSIPLPLFLCRHSRGSARFRHYHGYLSTHSYWNPHRSLQHSQIPEAYPQTMIPQPHLR